MGTFEEGRATLELTLAARMAIAALLGFIIGLERESRGKSAGERTFAIVALGAAGFSGVAITMFPETAGQAVAGVATGIGFLGVGIIWRAEEGQTRGLTTAASILCVAAIGVVTGIGLYLTAVPENAAAPSATIANVRSPALLPRDSRSSPTRNPSSAASPIRPAKVSSSVRRPSSKMPTARKPIGDMADP